MPTGRSTGRPSRPAVFVSDEERKRLEAITFPAIGEEFLRQVAAAPPGAIVVHDVPRPSSRPAGTTTAPWL